mmetsp:Transcript_21004/g.46714  ORF Transcript_21004/g.46714 Transcript_21004/m.46714 type:complete len:132 (+) Transcript_21004:36-431(+)
MCIKFIQCLLLTVLLAFGLAITALGVLMQMFSVEDVDVGGFVFMTMAVGIIVIILVIGSCCAICSGDGKCKTLKFILGVLYMVLGLACIVGGIIFVGTIKDITSTSADTTADRCPDLIAATDFFTAGAYFR